MLNKIDAVCPYRAHSLPGNTDLKQELTIMYDVKFYEKYRTLWEQKIGFGKVYLQDLIEAMCMFSLFLLLRLSSPSVAR